MQTNYNSYKTVAGSNILILPELAFVHKKNIDIVKRDGAGWVIIDSGTPQNREVLFTSHEGKLTFNVDQKFSPGERVFIMWQH